MACEAAVAVPVCPPTAASLMQQRWSDLALSHPHGNYMPRLAGLLHAAATTGASNTRWCLAGDLASLAIDREHECNQSWALTASAPPPPNAATLDLRAIGCFDREWACAGAAKRIICPATPGPLVPLLVRSLLRCGRFAAQTPCRTWEAPPDVLLRDVSAIDATATNVDLPLVYERLAAAVALPPYLELGPLLPEECDLVARHWPYAVPASAEAIRGYIARLPSASIRLVPGALLPGSASAPADAEACCVAESAANRGLCAWCVTHPDGSVGMLHTLPAWRGRGLGATVVRLLLLNAELWRRRELQRAAEQEGGPRAHALARIAPHAHVVVGNRASERLFASLGFRPVNDVAWLVSAELAPRFRLRPIEAPCGDAAVAGGEWADLLALVNASYAEDDACWTDEVRASAASLRAAGAEGVFYVGYEEPPPAALVPADFAGPVDTEEAEEEGEEEEGRGYLPGRWPHVLLRSCSPPTAAASNDGAATGPLPDAASSEAPAAAPRRRLACAVHLAVDDAAACAKLGLLVVHPALKRRGVAARVLEFATATARDTHGCAALACSVVSVKPWLRDFYAARGFVEVGTEPWPGGPTKRPCHFWSMRKSLLPQQEQLPA